MTELYLFLCGCGWIILGLYVLGEADPHGDHDDIIMGSEPHILRFGLALVCWPVILLLIHVRNGR